MLIQQVLSALPFPGARNEKQVEKWEWSPIHISLSAILPLAESVGNADVMAVEY